MRVQNDITTNVIKGNKLMHKRNVYGMNITVDQAVHLREQNL